eukprot:5099238-Amphidinium_carterae.1
MVVIIASSSDITPPQKEGVILSPAPSRQMHAASCRAARSSPMQDVPAERRILHKEIMLLSLGDTNSFFTKPIQDTIALRLQIGCKEYSSLDTLATVCDAYNDATNPRLR